MPRASALRRTCRATPLLRHPLLDEATGLSIWVKHENHNPTCAFKVRGGLNLVGAMTPDERAPRHRHRQHRQSRPVDRPGVAHPRRDVHGVRARRQQPREERRDARLRRDASKKAAGISTRRASAARQRAARDRRALRAFGRRAAADRRRRHLRAGSLRGAAERRRRSSCRSAAAPARAA